MRTNAMRMMFALASVAILSASIIASGQKSSGANPLAGTSWQLVKFQAPDESIVTPDARVVKGLDPVMPAADLSPADLAAIVELLKTVK